MEIKITTRQMLTILYVISWIIFIGLCFEAGAVIVYAFLMAVLKPGDIKHLWQQIDLSALYQYDHGHFFVEVFFISIAAVMKAYIFYLVIKILHDKKLNMSQPFNKDVKRFIFKLSYLSLGIGLFSDWGVKYSKWLITKGVKMPDAQDLQLGGADVWIFMGITLLILAQIFKRGIEIQTENELTI